MNYSDNPAVVAYDLLSRWAARNGLEVNDTNLEELRQYYEEEVEYRINRIHRGTKE